MADLNEAISQLRKLNETVPNPPRLPSEEEVRTVEAETGLSFPFDLRVYFLEARDVVYGAIEPVTLTDADTHTFFPTVLAEARECGVPTDLIPICGDNADFYCVAESGQVVFWSHNGLTNERWPSVAAWIAAVWIGESE
ncbi:MAG: SMI1/KNR4 family protein [Minwuiales bacterium]|nr:SMI1/KNR4 family protein [Minwuiales bacterium]